MLLARQLHVRCCLDWLVLTLVHVYVHTTATCAFVLGETAVCTLITLHIGLQAAAIRANQAFES